MLANVAPGWDMGERGGIEWSNRLYVCYILAAARYDRLMHQNPYQSPAPITHEESPHPTSSNAELFGFIAFYAFVVIVAVVTGIALRLGVVPTLP